MLDFFKKQTTLWHSNEKCCFAGAPVGRAGGSGRGFLPRVWRGVLHALRPSCLSGTFSARPQHSGSLFKKFYLCPFCPFVAIFHGILQNRVLWLLLIFRCVGRRVPFCPPCSTPHLPLALPGPHHLAGGRETRWRSGLGPSAQACAWPRPLAPLQGPGHYSLSWGGQLPGAETPPCLTAPC